MLPILLRRSDLKQYISIMLINYSLLDARILWSVFIFLNLPVAEKSNNFQLVNWKRPVLPF